jgi:hypothetical protein
MDKSILKLTNIKDASTLQDSERMLRSFFRTIEPHKKRNWRDPQRISWEVFAEKDKIGFYVVAPKRLQKLLKSRIIDAYPHIEIKEVEEDHVDKFQKPFVAKMDFKKHFMYSTSLKFDNGNVPLQSILNSMSRLEEGDRMLLQISLLPINDKWQGKAYEKYRDLLFNGKKPEPLKSKSLLTKGAVYSIKGFFKIIEEFIKLFINMKDDKHKNTPIERAEVKATQKKISLPAFNASIRLAVESKDKNTSSVKLSELANSFIEVDGDNEWRRSKINAKRALREIKERMVDKTTNNIVTTAELSPIVRMNNKDTLVPELSTGVLKTHPIPQSLDEGVHLGIGLHGSSETELKISEKHVDDLVHPMTITGGMGGGKTTLQINLALARALAGYGVIMMDTQGDMSQDFLKQLPQSEWHRVVWLNFGDLQHPIALDLMEFISLGKGDNGGEDFVKDWAKDELVAIMKKMWGQNFGPQTEYITRNNISATIETNGTFMEMFRMLVDDGFREEVVSQIKFKAPFAWSFWRTFQDNFSLQQKMRMVMPSINKIGSFVENRIIRNITSQGKQSYNFRDMMDEGKIVVVTIPKGNLIGTWQLIGSLIVSKIWLASLSRHNMPVNERKPCFLICDEAEDIINDTFPIMLSQSRKYRLGIIMGFQYLDQIKRNNRKAYDAIIGNSPHMVALKVGQKDAGVYEEIFRGFYNKEELLMPNLHGVAQVNINGQPSNPFTLRIPWNYFTKDNSPRASINGALDTIREESRKLYAKPKEEVERIVNERYESVLSSMELSDEVEDIDYEVDASEDMIKNLRDLG